MADALVASTLELLKRELLGEIRHTERPGALDRVPLRGEIRHNATDLVAVHPVGALVGTSIVSEANLAARHRCSDDLGEVADLIVVRRDTYVERFIPDRVDRGLKGSQERP